MAYSAPARWERIGGMHVDESSSSCGSSCSSDSGLHNGCRTRAYMSAAGTTSRHVEFARQRLHRTLRFFQRPHRRRHYQNGCVGATVGGCGGCLTSAVLGCKMICICAALGIMVESARRVQIERYRRRAYYEEEESEDDASVVDQGLDPAVIQHLTIVSTFNAQEAARQSDGQDLSSQCMVCMEPFGRGDSLRTLPCLHRYHQTCIDAWLRRSTQCPICKHDVTEIVMPTNPATTRPVGSRRGAIARLRRYWRRADNHRTASPPLPPSNPQEAPSRSTSQRAVSRTTSSESQRSRQRSRPRRFGFA